MRRAGIGMVGAMIGLTALGGVRVTEGAQGASLNTTLSGFEEVLAGVGGAVLTPGSGEFRGKIRPDGTAIDYTLSYTFPDGTSVLQAHFHFGQRHTTGGVTVFLCADPSIVLPAGIPVPPVCPTPSGSVPGVIEADAVIGLAGQGLPADDLDALVQALQAGAIYVNVHTAAFPAGELRGQIDAPGARP